MAQRNHRGEFVWYELMTSDPGAAQAFYGDVVGWDTRPFEGGPIPYTMWMKGETPIGGVFEVPDPSRAGGWRVEREFELVRIVRPPAAR